MGDDRAKLEALEMVDAFNAHDIDPIMALFVDDCVFVSGERDVSEWTLTGTTVDGQKIEVRGCDLWTFRGDKIVVKDSYWKIVES